MQVSPQDPSKTLYLCVENTECAIANAYNAGFQAIELDVRLSSDGIPVIAHDVAIAKNVPYYPFGSNSITTWNSIANAPNAYPAYVGNSFAVQGLNSSYPSSPLGPSNSNPLVSQFTAADLTSLPSQLADRSSSAASKLFNLSNSMLTLEQALTGIRNQYPMLVMLDVQGANEAAAAVGVVEKLGLENMVITKLKPGVWKKMITSQGTYDPTQLQPYSGDLFFALTFGPQDQTAGVQLDDAMSNSTGTPAACMNQKQPILAWCATYAMYNLRKSFGTKFLYVEANQKQDSSTDPMDLFRSDLRNRGIGTGWFSPAPELNQVRSDGAEYFRQDGSCCWNLQNTVLLGQGSWTQMWGSNTSDDREKYQMIQDLQFNSVIADDPVDVRSYYKSLGWSVY